MSAVEAGRHPIGAWPARGRCRKLCTMFFASNQPSVPRLVGVMIGGVVAVVAAVFALASDTTDVVLAAAVALLLLAAALVATTIFGLLSDDGD